MSTPTLLSRRDALQPARQQLDELDALLERMLALPVAGAADEPLGDLLPPPVDEARPDDEAVATAGGGDDRLLAESAEVEPAQPEEWAAELPPPRVSHALSIPTPLEVEVEPEVMALSSAAPVMELTDPPPAFWLWPLAVLNRAFDFWVEPLGPLGRWLHGPAGRAAVGGTGLLFLAAALAWGVLDWLVWNW
jgi:hypothetical protein